MEQSRKKHGIETIIKLFAPEQVGIELVPVQDVQRIQHTAFWTSVFLSVSTSILGALISLHASDYANQPVLTILWIFLVVFICLLAAFSRRTYIAIQTISNTKLHSSSDQSTDQSTDIVKDGDHSTYDALITVFKMFIAFFGDEKYLSKELLLSKLEANNPATSLKERENLIDALIGVGVIGEKNGEYHLIKKLTENII